MASIDAENNASCYRLDKTNRIGYTPSRSTTPPITARCERDGTAPGPRCRRPSERPARWHPEGCPCIERQPGQHLLAASRATRRPAHNQVSAPTGIASRPRSKGRRPSHPAQAHPASGDGEDEGPRGIRYPRTPSACTRHARAPAVSLFRAPTAGEPRPQILQHGDERRIRRQPRAPA